MVIRLFIIINFVLTPHLCLAAVSGQCSDCHTMHNSQAGSAVSQNLIDGSTTTTTNPGLLKANCVGCHEGDNSAGSLETPYVLDLDVPEYGSNGTGTGSDSTTLAGGNFYWVSSGSVYTSTPDTCGHNVDNIAGADSRHSTVPPGGTDLGAQITCAGTGGCHGDRTVAGNVDAMYGAHHNNDMTAWKDGTSLADSYRFLLGVQGLEDSSYEYRPDASNHNKYYGVDRTLETGEAAGSISGLCADCHTDFHEGSGEIAAGTFGTSGVWLRHPTNFDMGRASSSAEYESYNGGTGTGNTYSVISPVGTDDTSTTINSTVYSQAGDAIVMCLSCHRAHGTPYGSILRWNYRDWPGTGYNGCAVCHTSKD